MFCLKCGANNVDGAKFCSSCGAELVGSPSQPEGVDQGGAQPQSQPWDQPQPQPQPQPWDQSQPQPQSQPWYQPPVQEPPQEWPRGDGVDPVQGGGSPKKPRTGLIVGIVVGVVVLAIVGVVAFLFLSGTIGGGSSDQEVVEQEADDKNEKGDADDKDEKGNADDKDEKGNADDKDEKGDADDKDKKPGIEVNGDVDGTVFESDFYQQDLEALESSLLDAGLSSSYANACHYDDMEDTLYVGYTGTVDEVFPIEGSGAEVYVSLVIKAEDFAFTWDEDGYALDINVVLANLPADSVLLSASINFELDVEDADFPAALEAASEAVGASGDITSLSASSRDLADEAISFMGVDEDMCYVSIYGDASYTSLGLNYEDGYSLGLAKYSSGDAEMEIYYYLN